MILYPAIDLKNQKVVRLFQGDYGQVTEYDSTPLRQAELWVEQGATWIHIVDLDAAKSGEPAHLETIAEIAQKLPVKIQIGGGIRNLDTAQTYLQAGVARVVVGTRAVQDPQFLKALGEKFPQQVALGLDTKDEKIAIHGWTETQELSVQDFLTQNSLAGIACLIFTDIARDGALLGPNLEALQKVLAISPIPVIASGGISELKDLKALQDIAHSQLQGVIVGKALYEKKFSLQAALKILQKPH